MFRKQYRRRALTVRRMLDQFDTFVGPRDRIGVVAGDGCEIVQCVAATQGLQRGDHIFGNLAFIKPGTAVFGDATQHLRLTGRAEGLTNLGHGAVQQIEVARDALQISLRLGPVGGRARPDRHAFVGIADRGGERLRQVVGAPIGRQSAKASIAPGRVTASTPCSGTACRP